MFWSLTSSKAFPILQRLQINQFIILFCNAIKRIFDVEIMFAYHFFVNSGILYYFFTYIGSIITDQECEEWN